MKIIKRNYLEEIIKTMGTPDIKVITGVRRCGKSFLLKAFAEYVKENDKNANIIFIDYNLDEFDNLKEYKNLIEFVDNNYNSEKTNYIMIDEVQMCTKFEKAINNFHTQMKYDIYLTGSNTFLLSSDLSTLFTGRSYSIEVYPFSYKEFLEYFEYENTTESFDKYLFEGGFSGSYLYKDTIQKYNYIKEIYNTLILRDIVQRRNIQNIPLLESVNEFLIDNISRITSYNSITETLKSNKTECNDKTIGTYIKYLCEAFAFYKVKRYDIQGKQYLKSQDKYYLSDHSIKYALLGTKNMNYGSIYENIVALELIRRGYEVYIGTLYNKKIDFVASKMDEKIYIQVTSDSCSDFDTDTFKREVSSLLKIRDAYPKIIVGRTGRDVFTYEGIKIIDIKDFLYNDL